MGNIKALHTIHSWVSVDKDCVVTTRSLPPGLHHTYVLATHATNSRNVARCVECGNSGRIDGYFAVEGGEISRTGVQVGSTVGMLLIIDKLHYEIREVGVSNFGGNSFWINAVHCKDR